MTTADRVLHVARLLAFIKEQPPGSNSGIWVRAIQGIGGARQGVDPWCVCWVYAVISIAFAGKPPIPRTASCDVLLEYARHAGILKDDPQPGDIYLVMNPDNPKDATHAGIVTKVLINGAAFEDISGNTNADGGREGHSVIERTGKNARINKAGRYKFARFISS
jgi:hypothetical protein